MTSIKIVSEPLDIPSSIEWVSSASAGAINIFIGTVRNHSLGKDVQRLEFEAYESMAIKQMQKIANAVFSKWPVEKILIHHRTGVLKVGDCPVLIAVSAAHRDVAFEACRYVIDTLKQTVPIWKKEVFARSAKSWPARTPAPSSNDLGQPARQRCNASSIPALTGVRVGDRAWPWCSPTAW